MNQFNLWNNKIILTFLSRSKYTALYNGMYEQIFSDSHIV
jgi:hypothetical protein